MNNNPKVSVIIPVYNTEKWLRQCVDSVLSQTFTDFELILVDDGSMDNCGTICDEYAAHDCRIRVIHQKNAGVGNARNVGMDLAVGEYLIFLDSDDYWMPSALETLYGEAEQNRTQVLAFGAIPFYDGFESQVSLSGYQHTVQNGVVKSGPDSLNTALDVGEYYAMPCLRFYRLRYIREIGLRFDEGVIHEDEKFSFLAYLLANRVECVGYRLYQRRYRPNSIMTGKSVQSSIVGCCVALDGLLNVYLSNSRSEQEELLLERYCKMLLDIIIDRYGQLRKQEDRKTAKFIQKKVSPTLKKARSLHSLPRLLRLATYNMELGCLGKNFSG